MMQLHPQFVTDEQGHRQAVVLSLAEFESVMHDLEDLEDIRLYDAAKQDTSPAVPWEQVRDEVGIDGDDA